MQKEPTKRLIAPWLLIIIIVVFLVGAGFFIWYYINTKSTKTNIATTPTTTTTPTASASVSKTTPVANDTSSLIKLCESNNPGMTCDITKIDGNYAYGTVGSTGGGAVWYAKKEGTEWIMVIKGVQDSPPCSQTSDFPKSIVPSCL